MAFFSSFASSPGFQKLSRRYRNIAQRFRMPAYRVALLGVLMLSSLSVLLFHRATYRGLSPQTMDLAQLARNISEGKGFTTDFLRPIALPLSEGLARTPDLNHEPLYAVMAGFMMGALGPRDGAVWGLSLLLFLLSAVLLFKLAHRLSGNATVAY